MDNLPLIIGNEKIESMIILYGFIQQYTMFKLFSTQTVGPLGFFNELATVFSMMGLLVLAFSPSLWRPKYVVSWFFLFVILVLGGSTGPEFGKSFMEMKNFAAIHTPISSTKTDPCKVYPNCIPLSNEPVVKKGDEQVYSALREAGLDAADTPISLLEKLSKGKSYTPSADLTIPYTMENSYIVTNAEGRVQKMNFTGFMPQVLILYITNKVRYALTSAINNLSSINNLEERINAAKLIANAELSNDQTKLLAKTFKNHCGTVIPGMNANQLLSYPGKLPSGATIQLSAKGFKVQDGIAISNQVNKNKNHLQIEPMIAFKNQRNLVDNMSNQDPFISTIMSSMSAHKSTDGDSFLDKDEIEAIESTNTTEGHIKSIFDYSGEGKSSSSGVIPAFYAPLKDYKYTKDGTATSKDYTKTINTALNRKADKTEAVQDFLTQSTTLIFPVYDIAKSQIMGYAAEANKKLDDSKKSTGKCRINNVQRSTCPPITPTQESTDAKETNVGIRTQEVLQSQLSSSNYREVDDCYDLFNLTRESMANDMKTNLNDLKEQVAAYLGDKTSGERTESRIRGSDVYTEVTKLNNNVTLDALKNGQLPPDMQAIQALYNIIGDKALQCQMGAKNDSTLNCNELEKESIDMLTLYNQAAIGNSLGKELESENQITPSYKDGVLGGWANSLGENFTETAAAPVMWLAEIGKAFQAGAYKAIMPIIKNIIIAFILVLTPILLLMGLLVPAWAPGVILTVLISLFYIKCVGITMVLVDGILQTVTSLFDAAFADGKGGLLTKTTYMSFMGIIWAMAYMSSFAITAFLMFAAGDTKAVMSKLTGVDSTIKSTSQDIYQSGYNLAKKGIGLAAPGMGNTIISDSSLRDGITDFTAGVSTFTQTPNPMATYKSQHMDKVESNKKEHQHIQSNMRIASMTPEERTALEAANFTSGQASRNADDVFKANKYGAAHKNGVTFRGANGKNTTTDSALDLTKNLSKQAKLQGLSNEAALDVQSMMLSGSELSLQSGADLDGVTAKKFNSKTGKYEDDVSFSEYSEMYTLTENQFNKKKADFMSKHSVSEEKATKILGASFSRSFTNNKGEKCFGMARVDENQAEQIAKNIKNDKTSSGGGGGSPMSLANHEKTKTSSQKKAEYAKKRARKTRNGRA